MRRIKQYRFSNSYRNWNRDVYDGICYFYKTFGVAPNILLTSTATAIHIDVAMTSELLGAGKVSTFQNIGSFVCKLGEVEFCIDESISNAAFALVHDEEAEFEDAEESVIGNEEVEYVE